VTVAEHEPENGVPALRSGELDLLVSESYEGVEPAPVGGLESHLLMSDPLVLLLPAHDERRAPVYLHTLRDEPWIGGLAGTQFAAAVELACRAAGFTPRVVHRADEAFLLEALVAAGLGVAFLPGLARSGSDEVRYLSVTPAPPRRIVSALVRRGASGRPALAAVLDALRQRGALLT
jgi:DNA-binding transcriptional LysR family regulator